MKKYNVSAFDAIYLGPSSVPGNVWIADLRPGRKGVRIQKHVTIVDEVPKRMADNNIVDIGSPHDNEVWLQWDEPLGVVDPWQAEIDDHLRETSLEMIHPYLSRKVQPYSCQDEIVDDEGTNGASTETDSSAAQVPGDYLDLDRLQNYELNVWFKSESHLMGHEIHELA